MLRFYHGDKMKASTWAWIDHITEPSYIWLIPISLIDSEGHVNNLILNKPIFNNGLYIEDTKFDNDCYFVPYM